MISKFTWPNFRGGSDKEGTRVLIQEQGFQEDVKYGHTKIFIRSPRTLFELEQARAKLIPGIVILLQKQWRGAICRRRYKKMLAALTIMHHYRMYKMRSYMQTLANTFRNAKNLKDHGKNLRWPDLVPLAAKPHIPMLKVTFNRWRAWRILRPYPREDWPQLRLKVFISIIKIKNIILIYLLRLW